MTATVRTRFAPSPTGSLHVGNARIAILNWLVARHHGGAFILRIEDTDAERNVAHAERSIMEDMRWLGLEWDEGPDVGGPAGPYRQSERLEGYREQAARLLDAGHAYRCFCAPGELEARRQAALARGAPPSYNGTCRRLAPEEARARVDSGEAHAVRFRVESGGPVHVEDATRGRVSVDRDDIGDFVLLRSDGMPTYNFAVAVDDAGMGVTHVIRGAGHLSNTPRQALLYDALGEQRPVFVHVPTVLGPDRTKLSKRHGARPLAEYRRHGLHPDAVLNYLSLLAWSSPSGDEVLDRERLVREVTLDRIRAADVVFDEDKLHWLSARHIEAMPLETLVVAVKPHLDHRAARLQEEAVATAVEAVRSHLSAFGDITEHLQAFLPGSETVGDPEAIGVLRAVREELHGLDRWTAEAIKEALGRAGRATGARGAGLYVPVRLAVTGTEHGPPLAAVLAVRGREDVLATVDRTVAAVAEQEGGSDV